MVHFTAVFIGCLAIAMAKPYASEEGPKHDGPSHGKPPHGEQRHGGPHHEGPPHGGPHRGGPHHGGPPHGGPHPEEGPKVQYAYEQIGRVAALLNLINQEYNKDFMKTHEFLMVDACGGLAIEEFERIQESLLSHDIEECTNSSSSVKEFMKQNAQVVNTCMAGWKLNATLQEKIKTLEDTIETLDNQVKEELKKCETDKSSSEQSCYEQFLESDSKKSIDESLRVLRTKDLVEIRLLADRSSTAAAADVVKCVLTNSSDLRKDIYTAVAEMNMCAAGYGLPPSH